MAPAAGLITTSASADTVRVGLRDLPPGLGNPYTGRGQPSVYVWHAIFEELTLVTPTGDTKPKLAESWKNIDKTTWQFKLRPGIKFSNGELFNAAAAKATYDWLLTDIGKATIMGKDAVKIIASTRIIDDLTIEIKTVAPNPITAKQLSFFSIVAPKAWRDMGIEEFSKHPEGTGPYKILEFKPGSAVAVANPGSWIPRADVDRIQYTVLPEPGARTAAIISDQVGAGMDLVLQGRNGFTFPVGAVEALATYIRRLMELPKEERLAMGALSLRLIESWSRRDLGSSFDQYLDFLFHQAERQDG
ncbi:MAG: hypothetical protein IIB66_05980 [Proteobacteria bacterium]|nr:hypothetical protein [Pseudomonadota bacterium]